jgi:transposase
LDHDDRPAVPATVLKRYTPDLVVIESCGLAGWVHDLCTAEGYQVLVCNPNQEAWRWKNVKRKTDRDDALKLAKLAALEQLVPVHIPCQQQREYRRLVKYRKVLTGRLNRIQNNIRAIFMQHGLPVTRGQKAWTWERLELLAQHRKPLAECSLDELWRGELDLELTHFEQLRALQQAVDKKLKALALADERVQLLQTIPGVGRKTAEVVVAYLDDPHRLQNARQVSSYAGLVPRRWLQDRRGKTWRVHSVHNARYIHRLMNYRQQNEWLTVEGTSTELGVSITVNRRRIREKTLPATQMVANAPWIISRESLSLPAVQAEVTAVRSGRRLRHHDTNQHELPFK